MKIAKSSTNVQKAARLTPGVRMEVGVLGVPKCAATLLLSLSSVYSSRLNAARSRSNVNLLRSLQALF